MNLPGYHPEIRKTDLDSDREILAAIREIQEANFYIGGVSFNRMHPKSSPSFALKTASRSPQR